MLSSILVVGLVIGGTYALVAMGLTIQYGVARIMNLAHGEFIIAGSFLAYVAVTAAGLNPFVALVLAAPLGFLTSYCLYSLLLQPLARRAGGGGRLEVDSILVTFGLMFLVQGLLLVTFGSGFKGYAWLDWPVDLFGTKIAAARVVGFVVAVVMGGGLYLVMRCTRWGVNLRAVASRPHLTALVGIDNRRQARLAFALGGALAATGGAIVSMYQPFTATDGVLFTMKALVIIILGGVGNLAGVLAAGPLLGLVEAGVSVAFDPGLTLAATYAIFLAVLIWRPNGLFS